jgi:hypothetical protein
MTRNRLTVSLTTFVLIVFLDFQGTSLAQENDTAQPLFESHEMLQVRIEAPLKTLLKERPEEEYLDGTFIYTELDGSEQRLDLKLRTRGRYRRQKKTCNFPPVRLNFRKGQVEETLFANQDKMKLVTHCQTKRERYEQLVLREYLAYRAMMALTEQSFSARLMRITWIDTEGDNEPLEKYGFVIEDDDNIGGRIGMEKVSAPGLKYSQLDRAHTNLVNLFAFMIGNTDYSLIRGPADDDCCHNAVPFTDGTIMRSLPYDLDFSGLVNAPYAEPNPQLKIRSVKTRVYRGRCGNNELLPATIQHFQDKKADIYAIIDELTALDNRNRVQVTAYLDQFFKIIDDPRLIERQLVRECS